MSIGAQIPFADNILHLMMTNHGYSSTKMNANIDWKQANRSTHSGNYRFDLLTRIIADRKQN